MVDSNLSYWKLMWRVCEITVMLDFNFQLMLHFIKKKKIFVLACWNTSLMLFRKYQSETPFKGDNVKAW